MTDLRVYSHEFKKFIYIKAEYYARGKVLLSGEYVVLHGATALALPTKLGQRMKVQELSGSELVWNSYDADGKKWFSAEIDLMGFDIIQTSDEKIGKHLRKIFKACCQNNSEFLSHWKKYKVDHFLEFKREWGLGSSSSLIYNMASWADVNPYHLYFDVEEGSGYDVACAGADGPIFYTLGEDSIDLAPVDFNPPFADNLFFVALDHKVDSREAIRNLKNKKPDGKLLQEMSRLSQEVLELKTLSAFQGWISHHEQLISGFLGEPRIRDRRFSDYWGEIKSLGTWGGDMVLVTSDKDQDTTRAYFSKNGLNTVIPYRDLIL